MGLLCGGMVGMEGSGSDFFRGNVSAFALRTEEKHATHVRMYVDLQRSGPFSKGTVWNEVLIKKMVFTNTINI
jgi:hypothetical protein